MAAFLLFETVKGVVYKRKKKRFHMQGFFYTQSSTPPKNHAIFTVSDLLMLKHCKY